MSDQPAQLLAKLLQERIVYVADPITDGVAQLVLSQLDALQADLDSPVTMYLTGKGGPVSCVLAIYEAMLTVDYPIHTVAMGRVESWAALLVAAGTPGQRCAAPAAQFSIGPPEVDGQGMDFQAYLKRVSNLCETYNRLLAKHTGKTPEAIGAISQSLQMSGSEAKDFGLIDKLLA